MSHTLPFDTQLSRQVDAARIALEQAEQIITDGDDAD